MYYNFIVLLYFYFQANKENGLSPGDVTTSLAEKFEKAAANKKARNQTKEAKRSPACSARPAPTDVACVM